MTFMFPFSAEYLFVGLGLLKGFLSVSSWGIVGCECRVGVDTQCLPRAINSVLYLMK